MKKLSLLTLVLSISAISNAASIDHIMNYTPEYSANPAQQGLINTTSTVNYNPAGIVHLPKGQYLNVGAQSAKAEYEMLRYDARTAKYLTFDTKLSGMLPNLSFVDNTGDKVAHYLTIGGIAGGAEAEYSEGLPAFVIAAGMKDSYIKGSSQYIQATVGTAIQPTDKLSMSFGMRGVMAERSLVAKGKVFGIIDAELDSTRTGHAISGQFGVNYKATDKLNLGLRYDTVSRIYLTSKVNSVKNSYFPILLPEYADKYEARRDLPAILALGGSYKFDDKLTLALSGNYYFNQTANIDEKSAKTPTALKAKSYKNGWEASLGAEYALNDKVTLLTGYNYAVTGAEPHNYTNSEFALDSQMVGLGAKYKYNEKLELTAALGHYIYNTDFDASGVIYKKSLTTTGVNATYKF